MKTFLFPGQGSQAKGMGGELFDRFHSLTAKADDILGYSVKTLCLDNPERKLNETQFTQPALYVVNALSYFRKLEDGAARPHYIAGHSLGEYNALLAAECFDFETGLRLVKKRGELMAKAPEGRMAAIMNASREQVEAILRDNGLANVDVANYNTPKQMVISGKADEVQRAQSLFQQGEMMYYPLNTSGAFHSRLMLAASEEFRTFLNGFRFSAPAIPVIANTTARPYRDGEVAANLAAQLAGSVLWSDGIQYLMGLGVLGDEMVFEEIGHGEVLTKMLRHIPKPRTPSIREDGELQPGPSEPVRTAPQPAPQKAEDIVRAWNARYPIGTRVRCSQHDYGDLETRTEAITLFGHRAAIYMKGYNGYFDLTEIVPI
ncbi:ACP S-malonyltransferase [Agrobacterium vitis]|uniref:ACP S-malonyltransferase n=1 Tax=Agrobacterium vitis TaxID=373 RepID=UPI000871D297|nr:ACP S-malonyltransferase [Agrobacterium vitis]MCE6078173.1 ACP S-malonyltransferase [Agrobacterium vitis]MCF1469890.1 ACP S-malonyltransferase [Agrobacterium vitis]MUO73020.1 ACP S-malonyltransferase [Agrobacterium vitis]MUO87097.1 ACP S-malonyltransferase [Agrobacterium vitis]